MVCRILVGNIPKCSQPIRFQDLKWNISQESWIILKWAITQEQLGQSCWCRLTETYLNILSRMLSSNHIGEFLTVLYISRKMESVSLTFCMFIEIQGRFIGDLKSFGKLWS